jgi:undecaprenyl-diphosphatase
VKNKISAEERIVFTISLTGFLILAFLMTSNRLTGFDLFVQSGVFALRQDWLTAFMVLLSYSGNWQAVVPICLILLLIKKTRMSYGVPLTISAITAVLFYQVLKHIFCRMRPDVMLHLLVQDGYSFPSGHSLTSFLVWSVLAMLLIYYARTKGAKLPMYKKDKDPIAFIKTKACLYLVCAILVVYTVLMGFSRVYVGVHWPSDIIASWMLGMALLVVIKKIIWR